jgi:hypothetical protein
MKSIIFTILLCFVSISAAGQELSGIVKTRDGKPVENVYVSGGQTEKTNSNGEFKLKNAYTGLIFFVKFGFKPLVKILEKPETRLEIELEADAENDRLKLSECPEKNKGKKVGEDWFLFVPKKTAARKSRDVDYTNFVIAFGKIEDKIWLEGWSGINAVTGYPKTDWIKSSTEFQGRAVVNEKGFAGFDWSGKTGDGKNWRYIYVSFDAVFYITENPGAKLFFDRIIDQSCTNLERYDK